MFARGHTLAEVAAEWLKNFDEHESAALADLVNFGLACAGCTSKITDHDVEDPDGVTNKLVDLQDEYQASKPTDYPLIAKGKASAAFKSSVAEFYNVLIKSMAASGVLTSNATLIENIEVWFSTMSSAANRSFRHTATVICLAIITALCEVARENLEEATRTRRHAEVEGKKINVNKGRVKALNEKVKAANETQEFLESTIKDWFETVFIHRYRDVDARIRLDCVQGIGAWIVACPDKFFDGSHLRYLGWVLSDSSPATRLEVIRQLLRLYKDPSKLAGLKSFTERFRGRMVEIGTKDSDSSVRAATVELLDILRENGLLEPDDIDSVGQLIYDDDLRVRKSIVGFFSENINDTYNGKIEDLGGLESLEEVLPVEGEGDFESPRLEWLKFKSLAEMLQSYDNDADLPTQMERGRHGGYLLNATAPSSRFSVAAAALYDNVAEIQDWQMLSGCLIFDHPSKGTARDSFSQFKKACILTEEEEIILLEVLSASVKRALTDLAEKSTDKRVKLTKTQKLELQEEQEEAARHLVSLIPKLLVKFGESPNTAAAVLQLEHILNIPSLQDLRQDSATYAALLDDINKQFMSHSSDRVLAPASKAILHAKSNGELDDMTEEKVQGLWEDLISTLQTTVRDAATLTVRGTTDVETLTLISNVLLRIGRLASVSDCTLALEDTTVDPGIKRDGLDTAGAIEYLLALMQRALPSAGTELNYEEAILEDEIAIHATEAVLFYLMWKIKQITTAVSTDAAMISDEELEFIASRRDYYERTLVNILRARKAADSVCVTFAGNLLDMYNAFITLKTAVPRSGVKHTYMILAIALDEEKQKDLIGVFAAAEKSYAKLSGKALEKETSNEDDGDDPMDEDPESDEEDESGDEQTQTQTQASQQKRDDKARASIEMEGTLCNLTARIITSILGGVMSKRYQARLQRNKARLGANFKDLCGYLDVDKREKGAKANAKSKAKPTQIGAKAASKAKSKELVVEDEEDDDEGGDGDDEDALRERELVVDDEEMEGSENELVTNGVAEPEEESVLGD